MAVDVLMAKTPKKHGEDAKDVRPVGLLGDGEDASHDGYDYHIKVTLDFKHRLEAVAKAINNRRKKQTGREKRPTGWFIVMHLEDWLSQAEAQLGIQPKE